MPEAAHLDPAAIERLRKLGGDGLALEMIRIFMDFVPRKMAEAVSEEQEGNLLGVQKAAHAIKSSAANLGAGVLHEQAARIEGLARAGEREALGPLMRAFAEEYPRVEGLLEAAARNFFK